MFGANTLTDAQVAAAMNGSPRDQSLVSEALAPQVKAMVAIRLAPTPGQAHLVEDLSQQAFNEIAVQMDLSRAATSMLLYRAMKSLKNRIAEVRQIRTMP